MSGYNDYNNNLVYADSRKRFLATLIDFAVSMTMMVLLLFILLFPSFNGLNGVQILNEILFSHENHVYISRINLAISLSWILLPVTFELLHKHASLGKLALNIQVAVINDSNYFIKILFRNLIKYQFAIMMIIIISFAEEIPKMGSGLVFLIILLFDIVFIVISLIILLIDGLTVLNTDKGRSLHDKICNTMIIEKVQNIE